MDAAQRPRHPARARAAGGHRHHLRKPPERDGRRGRAVPEISQSGDPARRLGKPAVERSHPRMPGGRACRCRTAGGRHTVGADDGSGRGRHDARGPRQPDQRDRAARRAQPGRAGAEGSARAGDRAPGRPVPCLRGPRCGRGHGARHRGERQAAPNRHLRVGRNAAGGSPVPRLDAAHAAGGVGRGGLRAARRRGHAGGRRAREARHRAGLAHRIPRRHHFGAKPSATSPPTARRTPIPSSRATRPPPGSSCAKSTAPSCCTTPRRSLPTAASSAWARRSASQPTGSTPGVPWAWSSSPATSTW